MTDLCAEKICCQKKNCYIHTRTWYSL